MTARKLKMISTLPCLILHGAVRHPLRGEGDLPKGDITPYAYLVKWVTRRRGGGFKNLKKEVTSFVYGP